jgi:FkbM family methyltransferase
MFVFTKRFFLRFLLAFSNPSLAIRRLFLGSRRLTIIELGEIAPFLIGYGAILEAGASDGADTEEMSRKFQKHTIFAIEPITKQHSLLKDKFRQSENVRVFRLALSDSDGASKIWVSDNEVNPGTSGSSSLLSPKKHLDIFPTITFSQSEVVQTLKLESFCISQRIDFIDLLWIDLQGMEYKVISSSAAFVRRNVNCIHLEVSRIELYEGAVLARSIELLLEGLGFEKKIDRVGIVSGNCLYVNKNFKS